MDPEAAGLAVAAIMNVLLKRKGNLQLPTGEQGQMGQKERRGECEGIRGRGTGIEAFPQRWRRGREEENDGCKGRARKTLFLARARKLFAANHASGVNSRRPPISTPTTACHRTRFTPYGILTNRESSALGAVSALIWLHYRIAYN